MPLKIARPTITFKLPEGQWLNEARGPRQASTWWRRYRLARQVDGRYLIEVWYLWWPTWTKLLTLSDPDTADELAWNHAHATQRQRVVRLL